MERRKVFRIDGIDLFSILSDKDFTRNMDEFGKLNGRVKDSLSRFGFKKPTRIQEKAIPEILEGKNTLLIAPTGTGKTEAALFPVFSQFSNGPKEN